MTIRDGAGKEFGVLGLLLVVESLLAAVVARCTPLSVPNVEYLHEGFVFAAQRRIADTFLPVGYSGLLGMALWCDGMAGVVVLSVALSLLMVAAAWFYLRALGVSIRATFVLTALLSIEPDVLLGLHKVQEVEITAALVFGFVTLSMKAMEEDHFGAADVGLALTLGYAMTVRANLVVLLVVGWWVFWRYGVAKAWRRLGLQLLLVGICYAGVTTAIHGRPFVPRYGAYNVAAGLNEETQNFPNEEDSLYRVLPAHGVTPPHGGAAFRFGDLRDPGLDPVYARLALQFVRQHPGRCVELVGVKLWNLLGPDLRVHRARSVAGVVKMAEALSLPLWLMAMVWLPHPSQGATKMKPMLLMMGLAYVLPFLLTVSAPRFAQPLEIFCWVDLGAMVWASVRGTGWRRGVEG